MLIYINCTLSLPCCLGNHQTAYHMCHIHWQFFKYRNCLSICQQREKKRRNNRTTMQLNAIIIIWQSVPTLFLLSTPFSKSKSILQVLLHVSIFFQVLLYVSIFFQVLLYVSRFFHPCIPVLDWCQNWQSSEKVWVFMIVWSYDHMIVWSYDHMIN